MDRQQIISAIQHHQPVLSRMGVAHLSLFGSVARGASAANDIDVVIDTEQGEAFGLFRLARIADELERLLAKPVDVISRRGLDNAPGLRSRISRDLIHVF